MDTAHPLQPLTWIGGDAVVGEGAPWALAGGGAAQWLAPDWQGTIGDLPRDPWGAAPGPVATGPRLGYRGEVEFDGETWLRHRIYEPATRSFPQPDPLLPVPATASAANPYHYAANNPIGLSDPLGLRPITDHELQAIRNRMGHNPLQKIGDDLAGAGKALAAPVYDNAGILAAVASGLALIPPLTPFMAPAAIGLSFAAAAHSYEKRDGIGVAIDLVGIVPGAGGLVRGTRAGFKLEKATAEGLTQQRLALKLGKTSSDRWAAEVREAKREAHQLHAAGKVNDATAFGISSGSAIRAQIRDHPEHGEPNPLEYHDGDAPRRLHPVRLTPAHP